MEKKEKELKRSDGIKNDDKKSRIQKNLNKFNIFAKNPLMEYEEIIINIMEKIAKSPKEYDINGEVKVPYEMIEFLSRIHKKDIEQIENVFKDVISKIKSDDKNNTLDIEESNFLTFEDILKNNTKLEEKKDLNYKEFLKLTGIDNSKLSRDIKKACDKDAYDIDIGKFKKAGESKEDYSSGERDYLFKKEWSDIASLLLKMFGENPYYKSNSKPTSASLDSVIYYNQKYFKAIENEINEYNSLEIRMNPVYYSTYTETLALKKVKEKLQLFFSLMSEIPVESRANMWLELSHSMDNIIIQNHLFSEKAKRKAQEEKGELFKNQLYGEYEYTSLDKYIAQVLKNEMDSNFREERLDINRKKHEWMKIFDRVSMVLDGEEEVNRVNGKWNEESEKKLVINKKKKLEEKIEKQLKNKEDLVNKITDINIKIDKLIKNAENLNDKESVSILKELKETLSKKNYATDNFGEAAENVIQEINYNVMKK